MTINITITNSVLEIVAGIPKNVTLSTDVPASIFYTLDGSIPTVMSEIYVGPIVMPGRLELITLNVFATDGQDSSDIISQTYSATIVGDRLPHATVTNLNEQAIRQNLFPFGEFSPNIPVTYGNIGGIITDDPGLPQIPDGYDGTASGTIKDYTNLPLYNYDMIYSDASSDGERGHGIGTLPSQSTIYAPPRPINPKETSNINSPFFNPRALVIYQDSRDTPIDPNVPQTMKQMFSLENGETTKSGALLFTTAFEGLQPTGGFVRSLYNAGDNTITYYYFDSATLRWIISKEAFTPRNSNIGNYSSVVFSPRGPGASKVFGWHTFKTSRLI